MDAQTTIRPMPLSLSFTLFGLPALLFLALHQFVVPLLVKAGAPLVVCFFVLASPHMLFFVGAFVGYRLEGNPWTRHALAERFRMRRPNRRDCVWALVAAVGDIGSYLAVYIGARPVVKWLHDLYPEPEALSRIFGDATTFVGFPLKGNWWLLGVFLVFYFFNVMGEELWWRGYIFPRQELTHGSRTWIVHGLLWTGFHAFSPYNALMVLPGALVVSWIVQRRKNTWIFVFTHACINGLAAVRIVSGILA